MAQKKFVDAEGLKHFAQVLNNYPDNEIISTVIDSIGEELENKITGPSSSTNAHVVVFDGTTGKIIKDSGFTIGKSVPSNAVFTDTNTWRGIQNNLTSDSTSDSLSAAQGKILKGLIDGKTSNAGTVTKISTGAGLTGGDITNTGTIQVNLNSTNSLGTIGTTSKLYAVGVDANGKLAVSVPWSNTTYSTLTKALVDTGTETTGKLISAKVLKDILNAYIAANDAMVYKGTIGTGGTITTLPTTHNVGWTYKVITANTYAGIKCEIGDMIVCIANGTTASNNDWTVVQTNIDGAVIGPANATAGNIATFSNNTGKSIQDSGFTIGKSVPSDAKFTDTTYTFANGTNGTFKVTQEGGTEQTISVGKPTGIDLTTTTGAVAFFSDTSGTFAINSSLIWDNTLSSFAEGLSTSASGVYSHAEGIYTIASGDSAHAEGYFTKALGNYSHAEGETTTASANYSHAEGWSNTASGTAAHAEGYQTIASGAYSHAEGKGTTASGYASHAEGEATIASKNYAHAEGYSTTAFGNASHAEGQSTYASRNYAHAEGYNTKASGGASHAEGTSTIASGSNSHAEGSSTTASGVDSHAEGQQTTASATAAHAEGYQTTASGLQSHVEGYSTIAQRQSQHVFGEYNIADTTGTTSTRGTYIEVVGNGTSDTTRTNARTLDWEGNEWLAGKLTISTTATNDMDVPTWGQVKGLLSFSSADAGKFLIVAADGSITAVTVASANGVSF